MISRLGICLLYNLRAQRYDVCLKKNKLMVKGERDLWKDFRCLHLCSVNFKQPSPQKKNVKASVEYSDNKNAETPVKIWENMTFAELVNVLRCDADDIRSKLPSHLQNFHKRPNVKMKNKSDILEIISLTGRKFEWLSSPLKNTDGFSKFFKQSPSKSENLVKRPPVVTIMGHVDHGKTTLLDSLRDSSIVNQEFGGITQHIGAFSVETKTGEKITFIDTPGHAAFTSMRARGAQVTDLVVLVIAADDGVMEQTIESIKIARRAGVHMIVAVNKIDKPTALSIEEIKTNLLNQGIQVEDKGGDIQLVPISALKKINLDLLLEAILLESELMNLRGDPTGFVEGVVIESKVDKRGSMATVIVQRGTLKKGKIIVAGKAHAKVRIMLDENGNEYKEAAPSTPVQVFGWRELPSAGEEVFEVESEKIATNITKKIQKEELTKKQEVEKKIIDEKQMSYREMHRNKREVLKSLTTVEERKLYFRDMYMKKSEADSVADIPTLNLIVKGDVDGTIDALLDILFTYNLDDECKLSIVNASVGNVTQKDLELAEVFNAVIYAFNVDIHPDVKSSTEEKKADIRFHNVIYKLIDDLKSELSSRILPVDAENVLGEAEVNENFMISKGRKKFPVAGCKCIKGELKKDALYRVEREGEVVFEGKLASMKHHKTEVSTIQRNVECGLMFEGFPGPHKQGEKIICYEMVKAPRQTSWDPGF